MYTWTSTLNTQQHLLQIAAMDSAKLTVLIQAVKAEALRQPRMRKNAAVLARDVAAVWSGLRAAVMVDYMLLLRSSMFAILGALAKCKPQGPRLIVMHLDGCLYLIHADMLQQRSAALMHPSEATTFFVAVDVQEKTTLARAAPNTAQDACRQLANFCAKILNTQAQPGEDYPFYDLDNMKGVPIMPTLSGWLLQYPVVYLADAETAATLASLLSQASLQLYQVQVSGKIVQALKGQLSARPDIGCLCAFTCPVKFEDSADEAIRIWQKLHAQQWNDCQAQCDQALWGTIAFESCCLSPRPVQL